MTKFASQVARIGLVAKKRHKNLKEACVAMALEIVEKDGVEKLSLREVARRLGVSHQAPYRHFPSRDHILAEVASRAYADFSAYLVARPPSDDPHDNLHHMGLAYLEYALKQPLKYRLMFGTELPDPEQHPNMMKKANEAFSLLEEGVEAVHTATHGAGPHPSTKHDALFIWSTLHGLAGTLESQAVQTINLSKGELASAVPEVLSRMGRSVFGSPAPVSAK